MVLDSELEIAGLSPASGEPDVVLRYAAVPRRDDYKVTLREEFVFGKQVGFHIRDGREILIDVQPGASSAAIRVFLLGRVMAFLLRQRGWLPLHASGVSVGGRGVLFVAPSGSGKSTMATAFHLHGHTVITDDVGAVRIDNGVGVVQPGRARVRLMPDSGELLRNQIVPGGFELDKHSYQLHDPDNDRSIPIASIYVLETGAEAGTHSLSPVLATALLNRHSFIKRKRSEPELLAAQFSQCAEICQAVPVRRLVRTDSLSGLNDVVAMVEREIVANPAT